MATTGEKSASVADVRRDQMLAAAAVLIAERGFADTRIADVAARVGSSPALVIYYFGTRESLLIEALRWSEAAFYSATEEMLRSTTKIRERLQILVEWTLVADKQASLTGDWGLWFDLWAQAFRHPEVKKDRADLDAQWRDLIVRVVRAGDGRRGDRDASTPRPSRSCGPRCSTASSSRSRSTTRWSTWRPPARSRCGSPTRSWDSPTPRRRRA